MKTLIASAFLLLAPVLALASNAPADKPTAKAPVSEKAKAKTTAKPAAKPVTVAKAETSSRVQLKSAANQVATGILAAEAALSPQELAIADQVHVGRIACELGAYVTVSSDATAPGHFHVEGKGFKYHMSPVATTTGTVRLEDTKAGAVWLQIANKSMLMNQKLGQRLADECKSPEQIVVAEAIKKNPPRSVLD
ncbi:MAG: hypothetical protein PHI55_06670 [Burkholderiaceae bacterium]|nr:hypothetical protein [Burkholderiaceae bacterium]